MAGRRWFGLRPAARPRPVKKKSGVGGWATVLGGLGGLAVVLGLKRKHDNKKTEYSGSSYYSDYYSYDSKFLAGDPPNSADNVTGSESSSDRYTRRSGRSASRR